MNKIKKITQKDIAKILGVSTWSVSQALSNSGKVSKEMKDKVLKISTVLKYRNIMKNFDTGKVIMAFSIPQETSSKFRKYCNDKQIYMSNVISDYMNNFIK